MFTDTFKRIFSLSIFLVYFAVENPAYPIVKRYQELKTPDTSSVIWNKIDLNLKEIETLIKNDNLSSAPLYVGSIHKLVNDLPTHSPNLPPKNLKQIGENVKHINKILTYLNTRNKISFGENFKNLRNLLKDVRYYYMNTIKENSSVPRFK